MSQSAIRASGLGKRYRVGQRASYRTLRDAMTQAVESRLRRHDKDEKDRQDDFIWALDDVSFEVDRGQSLGVIGRNGAGKTTLLKILSRVTEPTTGSVDIWGRVGSLLEVGTGFHPELSGRENTFLNGAILGMSRQEIARKFDEIVAFADVERFIDTPVKRYSTGMYVRLAFSVAAHLEPEILVVDEVLSVGDAAFQRKCLGKMSEISHQGRTVLFVSHNLSAVGRLCDSAMWIDSGRVVSSGDSATVIARYMESAVTSPASVEFAADTSKDMQILRAKLMNEAGKASTELDRTRPFRIYVEYEVRRPAAHPRTQLRVLLDRVDGTPVLHSYDTDSVPGHVMERKLGRFKASVVFPGGVLNAGTYQISVGIARFGGEYYDWVEPFVFRLNDYGTFTTDQGKQRPSILAMPLEWETESLG